MSRVGSFVPGRDEVLRRLSSVHSNHKRIIAGALLIGVLTIVAKLFAAGREMAIAWRYGVGNTVDAYQLALTITTWLPMMLTSVITVVLVPRLIALERDAGKDAPFIAELNGSILAIGIGLGLLTLVGAPAASLLLASRLEPHTAEMTSMMSRMMSPVPVFAVGVGYLSARLQARERFAYSVTEAIPALVIALLVVGALPVGGIAPLVWGTVTGFLLQFLVLSAMVQRCDGRLGSISLRHRSSQWQSLYASAAIMALGQTVLAFCIPIDQAFAARLGSGSVATLGYANRIVILITGFGAVVLARALLPVLSRAVVEGESELGARHARQWAGLLFIFGAAVALLVWLLADWGVALVFQRGAFTGADTTEVGHVLQFGAIQLPFYFGGLALVQWIAASRRYGILLVTASIALAVKIVMNLALVGWLGLNGLMLATAGLYAVSFGCQYLATTMK